MTIRNTFIVVGSLLLITIFSSVDQARADWLIDRSGTLVEVDSSVLGRNDSDNSMQGTPDAQQVQVRFEQATEARVQSQETYQQRVKSQLEIKEGSVMQVKQAVMNKEGQVIRRKELELEPGEKLKVERRDGKYLELGSDEEGKFEIMQSKFRTKTELPVSIGDDNEIIITRPDGTEKIVSVLPDVAAENLRASGLSLSSENQELELEDIGDVPSYRFAVKQEKKFLGLFKRLYNQESVVSAETGEIVSTTSTEDSPLVRFLETFSF